MVCDELGAYLVAAGLGLVLDASLFVVPFPVSSPDAATCIVAFGFWGKPERTMTPSLGANLGEKPVVQVITRDTRERAAQAQATSLAIWQKLRNLGTVTLSGVVYYDVRARSQPLFLGFDQDQRPRFYVEYEVDKAESAA